MHTVPIKTTGECGSVLVRLIPAPRGAGIVAARTPKKVLQMAGIEDCYTCSRGSTKTLGNFVKATFYALAGERPAGGTELAVPSVRSVGRAQHGAGAAWGDAGRCCLLGRVAPADVTGGLV